MYNAVIYYRIGDTILPRVYLLFYIDALVSITAGIYGLVSLLGENGNWKKTWYD